MQIRWVSTALVVLAVAGVAGCSERRNVVGPSGSEIVGQPGVAFAKPDSVPPKPPPIPIVQFAGSDQAQGGDSSITRWVLGNDRNMVQRINVQMTEGG